MPGQSTLLDPTENEEDLSEFIRAIDESRQQRAGGSGLNTSRSSESASSSPAAGGQGGASNHSRRVSLAERRHSPLIGRLDLAPPAPPSPRSPPARLQELNLFDSDEGPIRAPVAVGLIGAGTGTGAGASPAPLTGASGTPLDLGAKLQNMDATFQKSLAGLKERRRASRVDVAPTVSFAPVVGNPSVR